MIEETPDGDHDVVVRASRGSWIAMLAAAIVGGSVVAAATLLLLDRASVEEGSGRFALDARAAQWVLLLCGAFFLVLGLASLASAARSSGRLLVLDDDGLHLCTFRGRVHLAPERIDRVRAVGRHLSVHDTDGKRYWPAMYPEDDDWRIVARRLDVALRRRFDAEHQRHRR